MRHSDFHCGHLPAGPLLTHPAQTQVKHTRCDHHAQGRIGFVNDIRDDHRIGKTVVGLAGDKDTFHGLPGQAVVDHFQRRT